MNRQVTRRKMGLIFGLGATAAHAQTKKPRTMIHQEIDLKTTPARIYEDLLDSKQFGALTKDTAEIQPEPGAAFKLFGGRIEGRNIELVADERIIQA